MSHSRIRSGLNGFVLATTLVAAAGCGEKNPDPVQTEPPVVAVARPVEKKVTDYQVFTARTEAVKSVDVKARVTGELVKINFKDGEEIKKDREGKLPVLFEIDDRPYKFSRDSAKAALEVAKFSLDSAKAALEIAQANLVKTQANYDIGLNVQKDNPGAISSQEIVRRLGARDEAKGSINKAKASIEEANSAIAKAEANLLNAQLYYDWCKVRAPILGRINKHRISIGNLVSQDVTVLTNIVSLRPMWTYFDVDQNTAAAYQQLVRKGKVERDRALGKPVKMWVGVGLPDWDAGDTAQNRPIDGKIDFVSNQLDPNTGSIRVRATFENKDGRMVAGLFARVRVPTSHEKEALLVNDLAIGTDQGQKFILVVNDRNVVESHPVKDGLMHGGLRQVYAERDGVVVLRATDRLVVNGLQRVRPGITVKPETVDMKTLMPPSKSK